MGPLLVHVGYEMDDLTLLRSRCDDERVVEHPGLVVVDGISGGSSKCDVDCIAPLKLPNSFSILARLGTICS